MSLTLTTATDVSRATLAAALRNDSGSHWLTADYQDADLWAQKDAHTNHVTYIALNEGTEIVGFVTLSYISPEQAALEYYVLPEHRGNRYATQLLSALKRVVREDNTRPVTLFAGVKENNIPSLRAIEKADFLDQGVNFGNRIYTYIIY